ncbi:MAG: hypothetical protein BGO88_03600 [Flavobacterium sp. 38-13]|nr:MAG: hypothetical protein BGO88_03600 [Flavobacterium sp. 38-13]
MENIKNKQHYKFIIFSFILINTWTLYGFFDYFTDKDLIFHGLGLFIFYIYSIFSCLILGAILILLRILYFKKERKDKLRTNFFYLFTGIFNTYIFIVWVVCLSLKILPINDPLIFYLLGNMVISIFILLDIYYKKNLKTTNHAVVRDI